MKVRTVGQSLLMALGLAASVVQAGNILCSISPANVMVVEGETLQLSASCSGGAINSIKWQKDAADITGAMALTGDTSKPILYTTPAPVNGVYVYSAVVEPTAVGDNVTYENAKVVVQDSSVVDTFALLTTPTTGTLATINALCGSSHGGVVTTMPSGVAQCSPGTPVLAVTGPQGFSWSCLGRSGGSEASCFAYRGFAVSGAAGITNGSIAIANSTVSASGSTTITATPDANFSLTAISGNNCTVTGSGNVRTASQFTADCVISATFSNVPQNGSCDSTATVATLTAPAGNLCSTGTASIIQDLTGVYQWTCSGSNGGNPATCSAAKQYTVEATVSGTGGVINAPTSKTFTHNVPSSFTATPDSGNVILSVTPTGAGCTASFLGNTITATATGGNCSVAVAFGLASTCTPPVGTTTYSASSPEPYVAVFDTLFDSGSGNYTLDSQVAVGKTKAYEFSNNKAWRNGKINNFYATGPKDMWISTCPGVMSDDLPAACKAMSQMVPQLYWSRDGVNYSHPLIPQLTNPTCNIGSGGTVYLNIRAGTTTVGYQVRNDVLNK